jgi:flavorubredoxin
VDLSKRKRNRLKGYDYNSSGAYFVTLCTKDKKHILSKINVGDGLPVPQMTQHGNVVYYYINKISEKYYKVKVDKYVIVKRA